MTATVLGTGVDVGEAGEPPGRQPGAGVGEAVGGVVGRGESELRGGIGGVLGALRFERGDVRGCGRARPPPVGGGAGGKNTNRGDKQDTAQSKRGRWHLAFSGATKKG